MSDKIEAPFTPEQVETLNAYQQSGMFHPFTCGRCRDELGVPPEHELEATLDGWLCRTCGYTQKWAWGFMADIEAVRGFLAWQKRLHP